MSDIYLKREYNKNFLHCEGMAYNIKQGDTLYSISRRYSIPLAMLLQANPYADMYNLQIGDEICIPMIGIMPRENGNMNGNMNGSMNRGMNTSPDNMNRNMNTTPGNVNTNMDNTGNVNNNMQNMMAYVVKDMETIGDLMDRFNMDLDEFLFYNNLDELVLKPGTTINVPMNNNNNNME